MYYLSPELAECFKGEDPWQALQAMDGVVYRQAPGRRTFRVDLNGRDYFVKLHSGVGWAEIFKNLLQLRLPVLGAANEWRAINKLQELGLATLNAVAYGSRGWNPARRRSFIVTEALPDTVSLEDLSKEWRESPAPAGLRARIIDQLADISRVLHEHGVCHRDYYLCHFLLHRGGTDVIRLSLIDLHRVLIRRRLGRRWVIKDLAGLYYSALAAGVTRRERLRFIRRYVGGELAANLRQDAALWDKVERRALGMLAKLGPAF